MFYPLPVRGQAHSGIQFGKIRPRSPQFYAPLRLLTSSFNPLDIAMRLLSLLLFHNLVFLSPVTWAAAEPTPVIVSSIKQVLFEDKVEALGTLRANESITVSSLVTEVVSRLHFDDGDRVQAGQVLAEMTNTEEQALLSEARALAKEAERQFNRVQSLENKGTAAASLLDERRRDWQAAKARLVAIESRLTDRLIIAPFAGVVGLRNISIGALVEPGDVITTLDDDSVMKLDLNVPSVYLGSLEPGLKLSATTIGYGSRKFEGSLRSIDSRVDPVTRSVVVRVILPNPDQALKPGMLMQVTLRKNPRQALVIPEAALMPRGRQQSVLVLVKDQQPMTVEQRQIEIGARRLGEVEVLSGLSLGEQVVTHGTLKVGPGKPVKVQAVDDDNAPLSELLQQKAQP